VLGVPRGSDVSCGRGPVTYKNHTVSGQSIAKPLQVRGGGGQMEPQHALAQPRLSFHIKATFLSYFSLTAPQLSRKFRESFFPHFSPRQVESLLYSTVLQYTTTVLTTVHAHIHSLRRSPRRDAASPDHTLIIAQHECCLDEVA
jgi:hypothetical protein